MALMTAAQTAAELQRKANLGIKPTNSANNAAFANLVQQKPVAAPTTNTVSASSTPYQAAADAFKNANWGPNGTANGMTGNQNLAAVIQQSGGNSINGTTATPYINSAGQTDYHVTGQPDTGAGQASVNTPNTVPTTQTNNNVGTAEPTGMIKALQQLPSYVPPTATGLNFADATNQVKGQIDPMFQRALEALQAQKHQDQLDGDQLGMARGGSHSGLAADLQNKVAIASAGKASDLDATRQTQTAQMAQDLVNRGQDNDFRNQQQKLAEYLGINGLNLQSQNQSFQQGVQNADLTGMYQGLQTLAAKNADRGYGLDLAGLTGNINGQQTLQSQSQGFNQNLATNQYNQGVKNDTFNQNLQTKQLERSNFESDRSYNLAKSTQEWTQTFQKEQYTDQKAQQLWDNAFKDKSFIQSVSDAAASRGLQWASLNQRDKEYIADSAFREKSFTADQEQRKIDNLKSGGSDALNKEIDGLYTGLTSGQITGGAAIQEIDGKVKAGIMSKADADRMKSVITTVTSSQPNVRPPLTQDQIDSNGGNNPQDLNSAQLEKLWKSDPTGQAAGRPSLDWASWYTDPRGKVGGISYEAWKSAYGPQIKP